MLLSKVPTANVADEALESHVKGDQMSFQTKAGAERFATVGHCADIGVFASRFLLCLDHLVKDSSKLLLLLRCELKVRCIVFLIHSSRSGMSILAASPNELIVLATRLKMGGENVFSGRIITSKQKVSWLPLHDHTITKVVLELVVKNVYILSVYRLT